MSESAILSLPADTNIGLFRYQQRYQHLLWMHADHHARPQQERPEKSSLFTLLRTVMNVYEWENGAQGRNPNSRVFSSTSQLVRALLCSLHRLAFFSPCPHRPKPAFCASL
jgi:hypothetical protein